VLALVAERPSHGFAIARGLAPEGEIGRVWSLPRPLVYRAIDGLLHDGLLEARGTEPSARGPRRTILAATPKGRRRVNRWLRQPVSHVRDVRSLLMLKLLFLERAGADPATLLVGQRERLLPAAEALERHAEESAGFERTLALWRLESTRAVLRFLEAALAARSPRS
jgi:DNA-binding PadR family transcriptional regulator